MQAKPAADFPAQDETGRLAHMNPRIFREYDVRGNAAKDLPDDFANLLGRAIGTMVLRSAPGGPTKRVAIGRDCRLTSPRLHRHLVDGILQTGVNIVDVGIVPTPVLYFAAHHLRTDGAVMVTGSHNPPQDNGFKILRGTASLFGDDIRLLRTMIVNQDFDSASTGTIDTQDVFQAYIDHALNCLRMGERRCKIVVDAGNGAGGPIAATLYKAMGFPITELYCDMDGNFPNHHPDPTVEANTADLKRTVSDQQAEVGIAFDGDADRIGVVDGKGRTLWGDQLMILLGRAILKETPNATFVGEVKCSQALFDELKRAGGNAIMWKVGHSLIKNKMKQVGAQLGGEMSGHIFFANRYLGFDDGVYSGARLLEILSNTTDTLADLYDTLPVMVNTPEVRIECPDEQKFDVVLQVTQRLRQHSEVQDIVDVDGVRANFQGGWGLVRASNTQPALVLRCEATTIERLQHIQSTLEFEVQRARDHAS